MKTKAGNSIMRRHKIAFDEKATSVLLLTFALTFFLGLQARGQYELTGGKDIVYGQAGMRKLLLDVHFPKASPLAHGYPLVVSIHGGGWESGDKRGDRVFLKLTEWGYAIACIDYRLSSEAKYPAQIEDTRTALRWLVQHSESFHLDTNRIFAAGFSAGAHLALLLGLAQKPGDHTIKAVCALYPPTDLATILPAAMQTQSNNPVADLLGAPVSERLELAREASPITYVRKDSVPVLMFHGDADNIVPLAQSKALNAALKAAGAQSTLIVYPGQGHGFALGDGALLQVARFFEMSVKK